jgi:hypothetical protein
VAAVAAAQLQKDVGQDAALEAGVKLVSDESRQVDAGSVLGLREEGCGAAEARKRSVQRGLVKAVAIVVNGGAIRRLLGLLPKACMQRS